MIGIEWEERTGGDRAGVPFRRCVIIDRCEIVAEIDCPIEDGEDQEYAFVIVRPSSLSGRGFVTLEAAKNMVESQERHRK